LEPVQGFAAHLRNGRRCTKSLGPGNKVRGGGLDGKSIETRKPKNIKGRVGTGRKKVWG